MLRSAPLSHRGVRVCSVVVALVLIPACGSGSATTASSSAPPSASSGATPTPQGALPLGDSRVGTAPRKGYIDACLAPLGPGAPGSPPWIHGDIWVPAEKPVVQGSVTWPSATWSVQIRGGRRVITSIDVPLHGTTGTFPIAASDPAYQYDPNLNSITPEPVTIDAAVQPVAAAAPSCLNGGAIGILTDGVFLFDALDAVRRDAGAHEVLDQCGGHPAPGGIYHHHYVPACIVAGATGSSTLVGYALDDFGIYVERDAAGNPLTDSDLDECHGRTSSVLWEGHETTMYHYVVTAEFPYTLGCYQGAPPTFTTPSPSAGP